MRGIKFRGIHRNPYGDKWVHGYYAMKDGKHVIIMPHANEYEKSLNERKPIPPISVEHTIDVNTLGQYTDLKDKNGVEIYEGDIVKINAHSYDYGFSKDRIGEIRFLEGCFGFYQQLSEKEYLFNELTTESGYGELEYYEVIGNIYDNSELIEKEGK